MKKLLKISLLFIVVLVAAALIVPRLFPTVAIPVGVLTAALFYIGLSGFMAVVFIKSFAGKAGRGEGVMALLVVLLLTAGFGTVRAVWATLDILAGPQEMIVSNARVTVISSPDRCYLLCEANNEEMKIRIHSRKEHDVFEERIRKIKWNESIYAKYKVFYFEHINVVYNVEACE